MDTFILTSDIDDASPIVPERKDRLDEVSDALIALGYTQNEIKSALASIKDIDGDTSTLIKAALKNLDL